MAFADPRHRHDEFHRGMIPDAQLAAGDAELGDAPISNGDGTRTWGPAGGGGGCDCCHEHVRERFVALGDTPETFSISNDALYGVQVFQGSPSPLSMVDPDDVTVTGTDVSLDTSADDVIVILYERECGSGPPAGPFVFPGTDVVYQGTDVNLLATIVTDGPSIITLVVTEGLSSANTNLWITSDLVGDPDAVMPFDIHVQGGMPNYFDALSPATFDAVAPIAGTWYVLGNYGGSYDGALMGAGTWAVTYPTGTPTGSLTFPGTDGSGSFEGNIVASDVVAARSVVFVTPTADLPNNYAAGITGDVSSSDPNYGMYYQNDSATPLYAAAYPCLLDPADTTVSIHVYDYSTGGAAYDGGLSGSGTYEIVALP